MGSITLTPEMIAVLQKQTQQNQANPVQVPSAGGSGSWFLTIAMLGGISYGIYHFSKGKTEGEIQESSKRYAKEFRTWLARTRVRLRDAAEVIRQETELRLLNNN